MHKPHAKTTKLAHRLAADGGHEYIDYHGVAADLNRRGYTSGKIVTATDRLNDIDGAILRELSSSDQTALATRLASSPDGDTAVRFINDLEDVDDVRYFVDEELMTTNRLVDLYANKYRSTGQTGNIYYRHIDPALEASDLVYVAKNGDMSEARIIAREGQSPDNVIWLEKGTDNYGRDHIVKRHATGELVKNVDTDFYPIGREIRKGGATYDIPNNMRIGEIDDLIYRNQEWTEESQRSNGDRL